MKLRLPDVSGTSSETIITLWHAKETERIKKGDDLLEITTDKATFDVPAPCDGVLTKVFKKPGEKISPSDVIAEIQEG